MTTLDSHDLSKRWEFADEFGTLLLVLLVALMVTKFPRVSGMGAIVNLSRDCALIHLQLQRPAYALYFHRCCLFF